MCFVVAMSNASVERACGSKWGQEETATKPLSLRTLSLAKQAASMMRKNDCRNRRIRSESAQQMLQEFQDDLDYSSHQALQSLSSQGANKVKKLRLRREEEARLEAERRGRREAVFADDEDDQDDQDDQDGGEATPRTAGKTWPEHTGARVVQAAVEAFVSAGSRRGEKQVGNLTLRPDSKWTCVRSGVLGNVISEVPTALESTGEHVPSPAYSGEPAIRALRARSELRPGRRRIGAGASGLEREPLLAGTLGGERAAPPVNATMRVGTFKCGVPAPGIVARRGDGTGATLSGHTMATPSLRLHGRFVASACEQAWRLQHSVGDGWGGGLRRNKMHFSGADTAVDIIGHTMQPAGMLLQSPKRSDPCSLGGQQVHMCCE